jgi:regulator of protease activity HflC (stomatin/prohibitin superfamily)
MADLIQLLLNCANQLSPLRLVWHWQAGLYYFVGRYQWTTGPGLKLVIPGLSDVKTISLAAHPHTTPLQTITLKDGKTLTYSASVAVVVHDPEKAYHRLDNFEDSIVEIIARILSENLANADPDRLDPKFGKRGRLLEEQRELLNKSCDEFGITITQLGLNNCVLGVKTLRLLMDRSTIGNVAHSDNHHHAVH